MRVEFHVGVPQAGGQLLQRNIVDNERSLRRHGILYANSLMPELIRAQMRVLRRVDSLHQPQFVDIDALRGLNEALLAKASETNAHTIIIMHPHRMGYPAGNKLIAARDVKPDGAAVFLDTDMIMVRPSSFLEETTPGRVSVCLDTLNAWSKRVMHWSALYETFDCPLPPFKLRLAQGELSYPIYNAGLVLFPPARPGEDHFGKIWHDCARKLEENPEVIKKRPWLDTISLAIAPNVSKTLGVRMLDTAWNCTTRQATEDTHIIHYHGIRQLKMHNWQDKADDILAQSNSPFDTMAEAVRYHVEDMKVEGDLYRRAMRHGLNIK